MKKITITLLLLFFVLRVIGQMSQFNYPKDICNFDKIPLNTKLNQNSISTIGTRTSGDSTLWLNYGEAINALYQSSTISGDYLFPDSTVLVDYPSGTSNPLIHALGDIFDAYSINLSTGYGFSQIPETTSYILDSLGLTMSYERNNLSVTDTLVVYIFQSQRNSTDIPTGVYTGEAGNFGYDSIYSPFLLYNYLGNSLTDSLAPITTIKIPLNESDTSVVNYNTKFFALPTPVQVTAGNLMATAFSFKPGYAYTPGEDVSSSENTLIFASLYEGNSYPYYSPDDYYNSSSVIPTSVRYNISSEYNGLFVPSIGFASGYPYDDHLIWYHITWAPTNFTGIQNISEVISNQYIYPNPASKETMLMYTLKTNASVIINIYDITGTLIRSKNEGTVNAGLNQQIINTQNLANGIYIVSIEANGITSISKLVVAR